MNRRAFLSATIAAPLAAVAAPVMAALAPVSARRGISLSALRRVATISGAPYQRAIWGREPCREAYIPLSRAHADGYSAAKRFNDTVASLRAVADRDIPKSLLEMPSMPSSTLQKLRAILSEFLGVDESDITPGSDLLDLGVDSLDKVELTFAIEQEFDIEITQDEVEDIQTVGDIITLVENIKRSAA